MTSGVLFTEIGYFAILLLGSWLKKLPPSKSNDLFCAYSLHDTEPLETIPDNSVKLIT